MFPVPDALAGFYLVCFGVGFLFTFASLFMGLTHDTFHLPGLPHGDAGQGHMGDVGHGHMGGWNTATWAAQSIWAMPEGSTAARTMGRLLGREPPAHLPHTTRPGSRQSM